MQPTRVIHMFGWLLVLVGDTATLRVDGSVMGSNNYSPSGGIQGWSCASAGPIPTLTRCGSRR